MKIFGRALLVSFVGSAPAVLLMLLLHRVRLPLFDAVGILAIIVVSGAMASLRGIGNLPAHEQREHVKKFALLLPVVALSVHAVVWTAVRYQDSKALLPQTAEHWIAVLSAVASLLGWVVYFVRTERSRRKAQEGPE